MVALVVQESHDTAGVVALILLSLVALALVVLWIAAAVSVLRDERLTGGGKLLWIAVILAYPFLGSLGWFLFGKNAQLTRTVV
ncbi:PLD nuclease N-terminal domain-containing protein [Actinosynnema sp. NPDC023658]|uniref:PLD nuclease N-terminal domain-containing protein n=1 Tax=Actinosynnema sp. NPDC023658 TaxID=3155465 RepID=UPI0033DCBBEA